MKQIIISGCNGKMGHVLSQMISERDDCTVVAGFDIRPDASSGFPVYADPLLFRGQADVVIDFSHPAFLPSLLRFVTERKIPAVIATTGLSAAQINTIKQASEKVPIFFSANMSLGVNLISELAKKAAAVLGDDFDIEIIEMHHNQKIDAPSGTALMLADSISSALKQEPQYVYDRHSQRKKRDKNEIGIHAVRGGTIVGEHEILFAGKDELVTIRHSAMSKSVFAVGAINAALYISGRQPGLYNMGDLVSSAGR